MVAGPGAALAAGLAAGLAAAFNTPLAAVTFVLEEIVQDLNSRILGSILLASLIGRSFRFFVVAGVIYIFGPKVRTFIEKYFDWLAWALLVLGVGGFLALKFLR